MAVDNIFGHVLDKCVGKDGGWMDVDGYVADVGVCGSSGAVDGKERKIRHVNGAFGIAAKVGRRWSLGSEYGDLV